MLTIGQFGNAYAKGQEGTYDIGLQYSYLPTPATWDSVQWMIFERSVVNSLIISHPLTQENWNPVWVIGVDQNEKENEVDR